jgi:xanthine dehydrogenase small subunit
MRDWVLLYVNGKRHELRAEAALMPLADFLRTVARLTGTKIVCAEGDCGSCTVLIGRPVAGHIEYRPVTSCIQYTAQLDGTHIITVEGLGSPERLHPVQQAMVDCHGAQCGYCTPGMVATLCELFERQPQPSRAETTRALVGNLCRCTGYDSILAATASVDGAAVQKLAELYPEGELLPVLKQAQKETVVIQTGNQAVLKPGSFAEALRLRSQHPSSTILAGGTDLGVLWNKGKKTISQLLCIGHLDELQGMQQTVDVWSIRAATSLSDLEQAAGEVLPTFAEYLERFGSPPIRHAGTLGGNLANGSPIGDTIPVLMALDAEVELASVGGSRKINMSEFYSGYRQTVMRPDELIVAVHVPLPKRTDIFQLHKVSKRRDLDISTFAAAFWLGMQGNVIHSARIALGGVAATVVRLPKTEQSLSEQPLSETTMRRAAEIARQEISPISDVRGSAEYRSLLAENVFLKVARKAMKSISVPKG